MNKIISRIQRRFIRSCNNNINYETLQRMQRENSNLYIIDVRTKDEYNGNHINGAINIPLQEIQEKIAKIVKNKNELIILYCQYGGRSLKACNKLEKMGYTNIYNLQRRYFGGN